MANQAPLHHSNLFTIVSENYSVRSSIELSSSFSFLLLSQSIWVTYYQPRVSPQLPDEFYLMLSHVDAVSTRTR